MILTVVGTMIAGSRLSKAKKNTACYVFKNISFLEIYSKCKET